MHRPRGREALTASGARPRPRVVAVDLDGTLYGHGWRPTPRTVAALDLAVAAGAVVVPVTGRFPYELDGLAGVAAVRGPAVCAHGALVYDIGAGAVTRSLTIELDHALAFTTALRSAVPDVGVAWEAAHAVGWDTAFASHYDISGLHADGPAGGVAAVEDAGGPLVKLFLTAGHGDLERLWAQLEDAGLAASPGLGVERTGAPFLEVMAAGVTKAGTLALVCDDLGVAAEDVVAFGDQPVDLPMLRWAGQAWAMANAHPHVLDEIPAHAPANTADGVAVVLEALFT